MIIALCPATLCTGQFFHDCFIKLCFSNIRWPLSMICVQKFSFPLEFSFVYDKGELGLGQAGLPLY